MIFALISLLVSPVLWVVKTLTLGLGLLFVITVVYRYLARQRARQRLRPVSHKEAVLITGATSGIGLAVAKFLYKLGYSIVANYVKQEEPGYDELRALASSKASKSGQQILFYKFDIRNQTEVAKASKQCIQDLNKHGLHLYAIINNAGYGHMMPFAWLARDEMVKSVETNLMGTLYVTKEFLPHIVRSKGRILNVSSGLSLVPGPTYSIYGMTKVAQLYFARSLDSELRKRYGVKCTTIIPNNFIKNTNIAANTLEHNIIGWQELTDDERQLYEPYYKQNLQQVRNLEEARKEHLKKAAKLEAGPKQAASRRKAQPDLTGLASVTQFLREIVASLSNAAKPALTLEESGILESYEDALRFDEPSEHIFAGDKTYNFLVGSLLLAMPSCVITLLTASVPKSLYK